MPINYGTNDVSTSGNFIASSGNFTTALTLNGVPVATGVGGGVTITNATDNRLLTSDGTSTGINAEANATFDGTNFNVTGVLNVDNLRLDANTISSTNTNGNIILAPNGAGDVYVDADTLRVGDANAAAIVTTNGTGNLTINTNNGTNSGSIVIQQGSNNDIILEPNGTGQLQASSTGNARGEYAVDWQIQRSSNVRVASGNSSVIGGGSNNAASGNQSTVGGGYVNAASGINSTVGGGRNNSASGDQSTVGGGRSNSASGYASAVGGGRNNSASGSRSAVGGGSNNSASGGNSTVGGGGFNTASNNYSTVGGGTGNTASGSYSTVGGGTGNTTSGSDSTVGGGRSNSASGSYSTVGGGRSNSASGSYSTVGGGKDAIASLYGEEARSSGKFNIAGDSQIRKFILRNKSQGAVFTSLYLDGTSSEIVIPNNSSWFYSIKVIAKNADDIETAAYEFKGAIEKTLLSTIILGDTKQVVHEDNANWDCNVSIINDQILRINTISDTNQDNVYWVAYVEIVQVIVPSVSPSYSYSS